MIYEWLVLITHTVFLFVCDAVAKLFDKNTKSHNGYHLCNCCMGYKVWLG